MRAVLCCFAIFCSLQLSLSLENGLGQKPPMGWLSWERYRCIIDCDTYPDDCISEQLFRRMADYMVSDGYLDAGYEYIIIDDCWSEKERDENGRLQADFVRFPSGIKNLSDYVHDKGLKFGIYGDYGTYTCGGYPGSLDYLQVDAETFAEWGVDYLKLDGCYSEIEDMPEGYAEMGRYLNETGRPIMYSCSWAAYMELNNVQPNYTAMGEVCNLWRNWADIDDSWSSVTGIIDWFASNQDRIAEFAAPGHWNDPDMLVIGNFGLSYEQSKSQMAIWAILAAPLIMSVDLVNIRPIYRDILLNSDAIAINQDALGIQGMLAAQRDNIDIWTRPVLPLVNGEQSYAVAFASRRTDGYLHRIQVKLSDIGLTAENGYEVTNIFGEVEDAPSYLPSEHFTVFVPPTGVVFIKAVPSRLIKLKNLIGDSNA